MKPSQPPLLRCLAQLEEAVLRDLETVIRSEQLLEKAHALACRLQERIRAMLPGRSAVTDPSRSSGNHRGRRTTTGPSDGVPANSTEGTLNGPCPEGPPANRCG